MTGAKPEIFISDIVFCSLRTYILVGKTNNKHINEYNDG